MEVDFPSRFCIDSPAVGGRWSPLSQSEDFSDLLIYLLSKGVSGDPRIAHYLFNFFCFAVYSVLTSHMYC